MTPRDQSSQSKKVRSDKSSPKSTTSGLEPVPKHLSDAGAILHRAKLHPQKLTSTEIQHLQRTVGNLAVSRLLVSKNKSATIQKKDGDPFGKMKNPKKGPHDYRLYAQYDPSPRGWKKKRTKKGVDYYDHPVKGWELSHPVILSRGLERYSKNKFRDHIRELQQKLQVALGGRKGSGMRSVDGSFGIATRRAVRRFQKAEKLPITGKATYDTWAKLDQRGSEGVKFGKVSYETEEKLIGSTPGTYGGMAAYGWSADDKKMEVTVAIKFTNLSGEGPTVAKYIQKFWNTFKVTYKKDKDGKKSRTKNTSIDLDFVLKPTGAKKGPTLYPNNQVLLWRGNHPNWKNRGAGWPASHKKTRSDAGNWNLDDADVETMVGHEFGHLVGLDDEYARTHKDIQALTGETPMGTTEKEALTPDQEIKYNSLIGAVTGANDLDSLKKANTTAWTLKKSPNQIEFLAQEYKKRAGKNLADTFKQKVKAVYTKVQAESPDFSDMLKTFFKLRDAGKTLGYDKLIKHIQNREADKVWQQWVGNFPDGNAHKVWWKYWGGTLREYVSGGLMGDYTLLNTKKEEVRPNAVAHTHKHPLEPRHVRRFAEFVSRYNNEVWEAEYR